MDTTKLKEYWDKYKWYAAAIGAVVVVLMVL